MESTNENKSRAFANENRQSVNYRDSLTSPSFRKLRTYSYRRAINTPPKIAIDSSLKDVSELSENGVSSPKELHYQQIAEKGLLNDTMEEESDTDVTPLNQGGATNEGSMFTSHSQHRLQKCAILQNMSGRERKRQEAMFELISSESSYLRSVSLLVDYFMKSQELRSCMTNTEFHHLFSNVEAVRSVSKRFFSALERRRKSSSLVIDDVCDIVCEYVTSGLFEPYITYCSNESYQHRALQSLMNDNPEFTQVLRKLESGKACAGLPLHSFLLLPMQRITRFPLLIDSIRQRCDISMAQYRSASRALKETTHLVKICNDRAKSLERTERMVQLQQQLEFKSVRSFAVVSSNRFLLKRGPIVKVSEEVVLGFRRLSRQEIYLFLFNDVLLIAKKKNGDFFSVTDICKKPQIRTRDIINDVYSFFLIMEKNEDGEEVEVRLEADKPNTKARWMMALRNNALYKTKIKKEDMQVEVIRSLISVEPDMTSLKIMDVYVVLSTSPDGWIYGERLSDGCRTWLPSTHTKEILNEKIRERNLQRRNRLMGEETII